jgi:hypothetical protein
VHHPLLEKDQTIESMARTIEELKRKAEQGSQQSQGEVLELELEGLLRARFHLLSTYLIMYTGARTRATCVLFYQALVRARSTVPNT